MKALDRNHVIAWLRAEAQKLLDAAQALEGAPSTPSASPRRASTTNGFWPPARPMTPEAVRARLKETGARVSDIAKYFGATPEQVKAIIDNPDNGIIVAERGWLKLKPEDVTRIF